MRSNQNFARHLSMNGVLRTLVFGAVLVISSAVFAEDQFVLVRTPPDVQPGMDFPSQLVAWKQSGMITGVELFESVPGDEAQFRLFGILRFPDRQAVETWQAEARASLGPDVRFTDVDLLADLGSSPYAKGSVFQVMQYDVFVDRTQFEGYIEGYQLPEMLARNAHGGLVRYSSYYALPGSTAPWQSLIIMEYKNTEAFKESKVLNKKLGEELAMKDSRFRELKQTKHDLRNKTATTRAKWVALPISATNE